MLAAVMVALNTNAAKGDEFTIDNLTYKVLTENTKTKTGTVSVKAADTGLSGAVTIPETVTSNDFTYTVNTVVSKGFQNCNSITSVVLPPTMTKLNTYAFSGCSVLRSINFPSGITSIPKECFYKCGFTQVTLPNTITTLGSFAFGYCEKLTKVVMSENVTNIPNGCFLCCRNLSSIDLSRVKRINKQAFLSCASLTELSLDSLNSLYGVWIFQDCTSLRKVKLGEGVTSIPQQCFDGCTKLADINLQNIVKIGNSAFHKCISLTGLTWSDSLKFIDSYAFSGCSGLVNVVIPNSVDTLGYVEPFRDCENLESITLPNKLRTITAGFINCDNGISGYSKVENIEIPTSVKKIENWCFAGSSIRVLKIPNSVEEIGYCNLRSCNSLHTTLPSWLKKADWGVYSKVASRFGGNRGPDELTWPAYVKQMTYSYQGLQASSIYVMGDTILKNMARNGDPCNLYVKRSVFLGKFPDGVWDGIPVSCRIPVSMTNTSGSPIRYKTLCRDFDVDLTHTNDSLPEGVEPLRAYIVEGVDGENRKVFLREIRYIPSRLKANVRDGDGKLYQGVDEYVGVLLSGTAGYTYYYEMGEHDYTQGAEGQWLMNEAMEYSNASFSQNLLSGDANDEFYVHRTVMDENDGEIVNYGLNNNRFKIYSRDGWLMFNRSYLQLPKSVSDAIEGNPEAEGNADFTMVFENADGIATTITVAEFKQNTGNDIFYNPMGQRVKSDAKGIVISNGKKKFNR